MNRALSSFPVLQGVHRLAKPALVTRYALVTLDVGHTFAEDGVRHIVRAASTSREQGDTVIECLGGDPASQPIVYETLKASYPRRTWNDFVRRLQ